MLKSLFLSATLVLCGGAAFADEVVIHRDTTEVVPPSSSTTVETHHSDDGCASKTVHKENDMGDSKTVTKSDCD